MQIKDFMIRLSIRNQEIKFEQKSKNFKIPSQDFKKVKNNTLKSPCDKNNNVDTKINCEQLLKTVYIL